MRINQVYDLKIVNHKAVSRAALALKDQFIRSTIQWDVQMIYGEIFFGRWF